VKALPSGTLPHTLNPMHIPTPTPWRELTQAQLDWAYDQVHHAPNASEVLPACAAFSQAVQARLQARGLHQRHAYGAHPDEALDWYRSPQASGVLVFFVHGGAWRRGRAQDYAMAAEWLTAAGCNVVVPDFSTVTDRDGQLGVLADQVQRALAWVVQHAAAHGADAQRVVLVGHSSGAHLAATLATTPVATRPAGLKVRGLLSCSGMYDLEAVSHSARSSYVQFTPELVETLSPQRHLDRIAHPVRLLIGQNESPEFIRQGIDFNAALQARGMDSTWHMGAGLNHFEMLYAMGPEDGFFAQHLRALLALA
jgi:arylformamidase